MWKPGPSGSPECPNVTGTATVPGLARRESTSTRITTTMTPTEARRGPSTNGGRAPVGVARAHEPDRDQAGGDRVADTRPEEAGERRVGRFDSLSSLGSRTIPPIGAPCGQRRPFPRRGRLAPVAPFPPLSSIGPPLPRAGIVTRPEVTEASARRRPKRRRNRPISIGIRMPRVTGAVRPSSTAPASAGPGEELPVDARRRPWRVASLRAGTGTGRPSPRKRPSAVGAAAEVLLAQQQHPHRRRLDHAVPDVGVERMLEHVDPERRARTPGRTSAAARGSNRSSTSVAR